jgi:hypothetical protein
MRRHYRAAYLTSADQQGETVLTGPEHATMSDEDSLVIGDWTDGRGR